MGSLSAIAKLDLFSGFYNTINGKLTGTEKTSAWRQSSEWKAQSRGPSFNTTRCRQRGSSCKGGFQDMGKGSMG